MPGFTDCYVLGKSRSKKLGEEFLAHFLPHHRQVAVEYEIPQYSPQPKRAFQTADDVLSYLEEHPDQRHGLYWENQGGGEARFGMIFPTTDGQMILGLSCQSEDEMIADALLAALKQFLNTDIGYITFENPPPATAKEFVEIVMSLNRGD